MADADLIVAGGGPAGMMAGLLFARAGCRVRVLEKHADFFRDFRGDTVHPSTMEILDQLGVLGRYLERPHSRLSRVELRIAGRDWGIGDLSHLDTPAPFIAMMPQWDFLDFLRGEAAAFPGFALEMEAAVASFIEENGRIAGVRLADGREHRAPLTIAADGRSSLVRRTGMLPGEALGAPMDVLWFRLAKRDPGGDALRGSFERGRLVVLIDRGDYWQCALVIPKGKAEELKARGLGAIRGMVAAAAPDLDVGELDELEDLHLLSVSLDRLVRWHGQACWRSATPPMQCRRSAASASILRFRMRSPPPTSSPSRLRAVRGRPAAPGGAAQAHASDPPRAGRPEGRPGPRDRATAPARPAASQGASDCAPDEPLPLAPPHPRPSDRARLPPRTRPLARSASAAMSSVRSAATAMEIRDVLPSHGSRETAF